MTTNQLLIAQLDNYCGAEIGDLCRNYDLGNPDTNNEVGDSQLSNLMFACNQHLPKTSHYPGSFPVLPVIFCQHDINCNLAWLSSSQDCTGPFSHLLEFNNGRVPLKLDAPFEMKCLHALDLCTSMSLMWVRSSITRNRKTKPAIYLEIILLD